ncbi:MAG: glycine zipper domain-containing protein [Gammaproteobacteria bacterium]
MMQSIFNSSRKTAVSLCLAVCLVTLIAGCSNMSSSEKDTLSGAGIGAATGAVVGELATGQPLHGLAIGAAAGAIGGWLYDRHKKEEEQKEEAEDY